MARRMVRRGRRLRPSGGVRSRVGGRPTGVSGERWDGQGRAIAPSERRCSRLLDLHRMLQSGGMRRPRRATLDWYPTCARVLAITA